MALGAGHAFVLLAKLVYDYRPHEISLGGRLKNATEINMSMKGHKKRHPHAHLQPQRQLATIFSRRSSRWQS